MHVIILMTAASMQSTHASLNADGEGFIAHPFLRQAQQDGTSIEEALEHEVAFEVDMNTLKHLCGPHDTRWNKMDFHKRTSQSLPQIFKMVKSCPEAAVLLVKPKRV